MLATSPAGQLPAEVSVGRQRETLPADPNDLWAWIYLFTGLRFVRSHVCYGHDAQFRVISDTYFNQPLSVLFHGSRGSGKSLTDGFFVHLKSRFNPRYGSKILAGSKQQSMQVYNAFNDYFYAGDGGPLGDDREAFAELLKESVTYRNGSKAGITAATDKGTKSAHVPLLVMDELDEIDKDKIDSAHGMAQEDTRRGYRTTILKTSTWHRVGGEMSRLKEAAKEDGTPSYTVCVFDVLERCPEWRSGTHLEFCGSCPIQRFCWADIHGYGKGVPKAKRSNGYYSIDTLIQKATSVSEGVLIADYLCGGPRSEGLWFRFNDRHIRTYGLDPSRPLYCGLDTGVWTGAVFFQVYTYRPAPAFPGHRPEPLHYIAVIGEYLSEHVGAYDNAVAIMQYCYSTFGRLPSPGDTFTDPAGDSRNPVDVRTVLAHYERAGFPRMTHWRQQGQRNKLDTIDRFLNPGAGEVALFVAEHCRRLIGAFRSYRRAKIGPEWLSVPKDVQHPAEDMIDALGGPLEMLFPDGSEAGAGLTEMSATYA